VSTHATTIAGGKLNTTLRQATLKLSSSAATSWWVGAIILRTLYFRIRDCMLHAVYWCAKGSPGARIFARDL
jgi:hypothetical protein